MIAGLRSASDEYPGVFSAPPRASPPPPRRWRATALLVDFVRTFDCIGGVQGFDSRARLNRRGPLQPPA